MIWTPERVTRLRELWADNVHPATIAAEFGLTRGAISSKASALELGRQLMKYTPEIEAVIREHRGLERPTPWDVLATEVLGISETTIRRWAKEMGLPSGARFGKPVFTVPNETREAVRTLWLEGLTSVEIGSRLNISKDSVISLARRMKLPRRASPIRRSAVPQPPRAKVKHYQAGRPPADSDRDWSGALPPGHDLTWSVISSEPWPFAKSKPFPHRLADAA